ncbi:MAG: VOC family protein [Alphaproteobacteria bacterium]|nr:VOC family protein [Alphaproteobacteria bacterium]
MTKTAQAPDLTYVALVVDAPERSAALFETDFGLPRTDFSCGATTVPMISIGASALAFFQPGDPFLGPDARKGVHHVAIAASDPAAAAAASGLATVNGVSKGLDGKAQIELAREATGGVRIRFSEPLGLAAASSDMVERIDHIGVASADNRAARTAFIDKLGCVYESQQTDSEVETISENFTSDTYNYIFHTRPSQLVGSMRVTFITVGDCELEFIQDLTTGVTADDARHDAAGNTRGDRSAIARYIASRGAGLHHIAFKTPDIVGALGRLDAAGHRMIDLQGRPGSRRAQIGFIHPTALGGVLGHFVERQEV